LPPADLAASADSLSKF